MNRSILLIISLLASFGTPMPSACFGSSNDSSIRIAHFEIGFAGKYKLGYWAPVFVTIDAPGGTELTIELTVPDGDGVPTTTTRKHIVPIDSATTLVSVVEMFCKIGRADGQIQLVVWSTENTLPAAAAVYDLKSVDYRPLPSASHLVVALGASPNLQYAATQARHFKRPLTVVELGTEQRLPTRGIGYDGVNEVFLAGSRPAVKQLLGKEKTTQALGDWIRQGGRLIMSIDGEETKLSEGQGPLQKFLPGRIVESLPLRGLEPLELFADATDPLVKEDSRGQREAFIVPVLELERGNIVAALKQGSRTIPLLVLSSLGFGQITLLAVDVERPEFTSWNGTRHLIQKILSLDQQAEQQGNRLSRSELAHAGYDDLAGQLRSALDQFGEQGVWFIPFELLFLCGVVYLLLIAPGDYLFLQRTLRKMELTWITFPSVVILCSVAAYMAANATKGDRLLVNQAEVVDVDVRTGQMRGACWLSLFSPQTQRFDLSTQFLPPTAQSLTSDTVDATHESLLFSWMGLPGTGLGGMESPLVAPLFERGYRYGPAFSSLKQVPLSIGSTKCFSIRSHQSHARWMETQLQERNSGQDALVEGQITSHLKEPLRNCVLLHNGWAYPLGTLAPGKPYRIDRNQSVRTIRNYLARLGPLEMESDAERYQVSRIFERMLLYQAADGNSTIPLANNYLTQLDMSHLLESKEAILMGQIDSHSFEIKNHGQPLTDSQSLRGAIWRFVVPIQRFKPKDQTSFDSPTAHSTHASLASEDY